MAKTVSQRVKDYRAGKAQVSFWVDIETKKRFLGIAKSYRLSQSAFLAELMASWPAIPSPPRTRVQMEEDEALEWLRACNGDHDAAIQKLLEENKAKNPNFVYNKRPCELPEEADQRKKFRRMQAKLLSWKKHGRLLPHSASAIHSSDRNHTPLA